MRWLIVQTVCLAWLCGCSESPHVERRQVTDPETAKAKKDVAHASPIASPHGEPPPQASLRMGGEVELDRVHLSAPKAWERKQPANSFILAEFSLPRNDGDAEDGRLTVAVAGGSVTDNVARWRQQFGDKPEKESQEKSDVGGVAVTHVDFSGTFHDQRGPFAPPTEKAGYRMLGAIFDVGGQLHFVKATGPVKTVGAHADEFKAFVRSLKVKSSSR
jgi:hypothetical protein